MNERELYEAARRALAAGESPATIISELRAAGVPEQTITSLASELAGKSGAVTVGAAESLAQGAAQGLTFGFSDEIAGLAAALMPGGRGYSEMRDAARTRLQASREAHPVLTGIGEIGGGMVVPAGSVVGAIRGGRAALPAARGAATAFRDYRTGQAIAQGARAGAQTGVLTGGLFGIGTADEGAADRARGALTGAVAGGATGSLTGAALPAVAGAVRGIRNASRIPRDPEHLTEALERTSGRRSDIRSGVDAARDEAKRVSAQVYGPLEERYTAVTDGNVLTALREINDAAREHGFPSPIPKPVRGYLAGTDGATAPSFRQLQAIQQKLAGLANASGVQGRTDLLPVYTEARRTLGDAIERAIPEMADANAAYSAAKTAERAFRQGRDAWVLPPSERAAAIRKALTTLKTDAAKENFRAGLQSRLYDRLASKGSITKAEVDVLMNAPGMRAGVRALFTTASDHAAFIRELRQTGSAIVTRSMLKPTWSKAAAAAGLGGAAYLGNSLLD